MKSDFIIALTQLAAERNLPRDIVLSAIEDALVSAYRKDSIAAGQDISVKLDPGSGDVSVYVVKTVVEEVEDPQQQLTLAEAKKLKPDAEIGEVVATESLPHSAGRIAAQTAKQVVIQRLREAERELVFEEYADKEGEVFTVTVQRIEPGQITVELGRAEAILSASEQAPYERYRVGQRIKVLLQSIRRSNKGPEIIVSRTDKLLLRRLFEMEVPEIYNGLVEIVAIAREAGWRSKVAVWAKQEGIDAVGSCVGLRGIRIQNIVNEFHGEKIDVVQWSKEPATFISNALSPSDVLRVEIDTETASAVAVVPDRQLSLAIGKEGQNARLAARLTGWKVDIRSDVDPEAVPTAAADQAIGETEPNKVTVEQLGLSTRTLNLLKEAGVDNVGRVLEMGESGLIEIKSFGKKSWSEVHGRLSELDLLPQEPPATPVTEQAVDEAAAVVAETVEAPAAEPVPAEPVPEATEPAAAEVEEVVAAEPATEAPETETAAEEAPAPEEAPAEAEPAVVAEVPAELFVPEEEKKPEEALVGAADPSKSIQDLPEDVWSLRRGATADEGVIRFREDIEEVRDRAGPRRGRRGGGSGGRGRRQRAVRRR